MDDNRYDTLRLEQPERKSRAWLWIGGVLGCLLCIAVIAIGVSVGGAAALMAGGTLDAMTSAASRPRATATKRPQATKDTPSTEAAEETLGEPPAGWEMVIDDNFDSNEHGWDTEFVEGVHSTRAPQVKDGRYVYQIDRMTEGQLYIERPDDLELVEPDEFFLSVDVRQLGEVSPDDAYGLVFRQLDGDKYVLFEIDSQGEVCVLPLGDAEDSTDGPCGDRQDITKGDFIRLVVVAQEGTYVFLVNGEIVGRVRDIPFRKGQVGVFFTSYKGPTTFEYDNFQLYVPPK